MGYTTGTIRIEVCASRHNDERDQEDNEAIDRLKDEIRMLIAADPAYARVAFTGVWGGL